MSMRFLVCCLLSAVCCLSCQQEPVPTVTTDTREPIAIMYRKDDPAFKKAVDDSVRNMIKSGEVAKLYDKWFMQPIPPSNTKVGLPPSDATKAAWANPNDKPAEEYAEK